MAATPGFEMLSVIICLTTLGVLFTAHAQPMDGPEVLLNLSNYFPSGRVHVCDSMSLSVTGPQTLAFQTRRFRTDTTTYEAGPCPSHPHSHWTGSYTDTIIVSGTDTVGNIVFCNEIVQQSRWSDNVIYYHPEWDGDYCGSWTSRFDTSWGNWVRISPLDDGGAIMHWDSTVETSILDSCETCQIVRTTPYHRSKLVRWNKMGLPMWTTTFDSLREWHNSYISCSDGGVFFLDPVVGKIDQSGFTTWTYISPPWGTDSCIQISGGAGTADAGILLVGSTTHTDYDVVVKLNGVGAWDWRFVPNPPPDNGDIWLHRAKGLSDGTIFVFGEWLGGPYLAFLNSDGTIRKEIFQNAPPQYYYDMTLLSDSGLVFTTTDQVTRVDKSGQAAWSKILPAALSAYVPFQSADGSFFFHSLICDLAELPQIQALQLENDSLLINHNPLQDFEWKTDTTLNARVTCNYDSLDDVWLFFRTDTTHTYDSLHMTRTQNDSFQVTVQDSSLQAYTLQYFFKAVNTFVTGPGRDVQVQTRTKGPWIAPVSWALRRNGRKFQISRDGWGFGNTTQEHWNNIWTSDMGSNNRCFCSGSPGGCAFNVVFPNWYLSPVTNVHHGQFPRCFLPGTCHEYEGFPHLEYRKTGAVKFWEDEFRGSPPNYLCFRGVCYGMSVGCLLFFEDSEAASIALSVTPETRLSTLAPSANNVRQYIQPRQVWQALRVHRDARLQRLQVSFNQTLNDIRTMLEDTTQPLRCLGIGDAQGDGQHAVVPLKLTRLSVSNYQLWVYDPNLPNQQAQTPGLIEISYGLHPSWTYVSGFLDSANSPTFKSPGIFCLDEPAANYLETPGGPSMVFRGARNSPVCTLPIGDLIAYGPGDDHVFVNAAGLRVGFMDTTILEIPLAFPALEFGGMETTQQKWYLPSDTYEYEYRLLSEDSVAPLRRISFSGGSAYYEISRDEVHVTYGNGLLNDHFRFDANTGEITAFANDGYVKGHDITITVVDGRNSRQFDIWLQDPPQNHTISLRPNDSSFVVKTTGGVGQVYLYMEEENADDKFEFYAEAIPAPDSAALYFRPSWNRHLDSIAVEIDHGADGSVDNSMWVVNWITTPPSPEELVIHSDSSFVRLHWSPVAESSIFYQILTDTVATGNFDTALGITADTTFVDSTALSAPLSKRFYQVRSLRGN